MDCPRHWTDTWTGWPYCPTRRQLHTVSSNSNTNPYILIISSICTQRRGNHYKPMAPLRFLANSQLWRRWLNIRQGDARERSYQLYTALSESLSFYSLVRGCVPSLQSNSGKHWGSSCNAVLKERNPVHIRQRTGAETTSQYNNVMNRTGRRWKMKAKKEAFDIDCKRKIEMKRIWRPTRIN